MAKFKTALILLNLLLLLGFINWSIASKESIIRNGKLVLLELAPVDPRSLMQGDYMQLRYKITADLETENLPKRGLCAVACNAQHIATTARVIKGNSALRGNEVLIKYFYNDWSIGIGAESYFFQEGKAEKFADAKYGGIRVDANGNSILQGLYGADYQLIIP